MEKKLMKMKKEIQEQNRFYSMLALLGLFAIILTNSGHLAPQYSAPHAAEFAHGVLIGLVIVIEVFSLLNIAKNLTALKDETKLRRLYNENHDERTEQIAAIAGQKGLKFAIVIVLIVAFVVSYFSLEAFIAMLACIIIFSATVKICRLYYTRTYTGEEE